MMSFSASFCLFALLSSVYLVNTQSTSLNCPILGPDFPTPQHISTSVLLTDAQASFVKLLSNSASTVSNDSAFSISLFSVDEDELLFQYHHSPPVPPATGVSTVDADSIYRIGSLTKVFSVWTFLIEVGDGYFSEPITRYVPELAAAVLRSGNNSVEFDEIDNVRWDDVTLGALASHMAGIARDVTLGDFSVEGGTELGFPVLGPSLVPSCGATSAQPPCDREDFFEYLLQQDPIFHASATPAYSNIAFQLLSYALESITNKPFSAMVSDDIFKSLNMTHSSYSQPPDTTFGLIPINESASGWSVPQGDESPWATSQILSEKRNSADFYHSAGSVFTSTNDLARAGRSILGSSLLSPAQTRRWLKPVTHTSDPYESVGHPWEILRIQDPDNRITDLYTKDGDVGLYSTSLILSPDHNIGLTVLVGGTGSDQERTTLVNSLINGFLPAIEDEARQQASNRFSGTYIASGNSSKTSFIIATDDRPGLGLFNATTINGTPLQLIAESQGLGSKNQTLSVRLYPTGLKTTATTADGKGTYTSRMSFRATFEALPQPFIRGWCQTWVSLDGFLYGGVGADEFVFGFAEGGDVAYVDWRALRERLVKSG